MGKKRVVAKALAILIAMALVLPYLLQALLRGI